MQREATERLGGHIVTDALAANGVDTVFCVPGESYLPVLDGLYAQRERIRLVTCRHESGAAFMAEAYGKLTGRPGICLVTRAPGACNASIAVHAAAQDSSPMILLVGQVGDDCADREAFQEVDYRGMFGGIAKWVAQVDRIDRLPEYLHRAFQTATSGRSGPVVLALPENVLFGHATVADVGAARPVYASPAPQDIVRLTELLAAARHPLVMLGGTGWTRHACDDMRRFVERNHLPVCCAFRFQDLFDNRHSNYVGDVGLGISAALAERVRSADVLLVVGARLGEATTSGYTLVDVPQPQQTLIHVHSGSDELGRVYRAALPINAGMAQFAAALADVAVDASAWAGEVASARDAYLLHSTPSPTAGDLQMGEIVRWLDATLPEDAILTNGAGNYTIWLHRFYRYRRFRTQLAPTSGSMGYGVPAAIAAKLVHPDRQVIAFSGDGCFLMTGQELATAVQQRVNVVFVVVNNNMYGTIRMHQEKHYPGRVVGTTLFNPDFIALAHAYGAHGERVTRTDQFAAAFERASAAGVPALIELCPDPAVLTPVLRLPDSASGEGAGT